MPAFFSLQIDVRAYQATLLVAWVAIMGAPTSVWAADAELVGLLALAVDDQVAEQLELSEEQISRLFDLLDEREGAALAMASQLEDLGPDERAERLRPLRVESQRRMAGILTDDQLARLSKLADDRDDPLFEPLSGTRQSGQPQDVAPGRGPEATERDNPEANEGEPAEDSAESGEDAGRAGDAARQPVAPEPERDPLPEPDGDGKLSFNFRYQPWQDVLDWFAEQADLSLVLEAPPPGTFNYTDRRRYTPAEALDVLNSVLLTKGYTLVRRDRMLVLVNLEDGVPPNLVTDVPLEELDERGEYELIRVLFKVRNMTPEAASEEVSRLIGPQGSVVVLPRAGMLQVTETAGRIRAIRDVIDAVERPFDANVGGIRPYELEYASVADVIPILRQLLGIAEDEFSTAEGTLKLAVDTSTGDRLLASGTPEMIRQLEEVLELVDVPAASGGPIDALQLEVYEVTQTDPEAALVVMQTLMAEEPGTRLTVDPETGNLVALATPSNHATIRATLDQMQQDGRQIEVIPLANVDPQMALLSVTKLFGIGGTGEDDEIDPRAPVVDADVASGTLLVKGSQSQIDQIKALLQKMGESGESEFASSADGNVRLLPLTASEARSAIEQLDRIWPTIRENPVRLVSPATAIRSYRPAEEAEAEDPTLNDRALENLFRFDEGANPSLDDGPLPTDRGAQRNAAPTATLAVYQQPSDESDGDPDAEVPEDNQSADLPTDENEAGEPAPILVAPGPNGLLIVSDDIEALDAYEQLVQSTLSQSGTSGREYAVFYLKHATAASAAAILGEIFGGTSGGGSLIDDMAESALGDMGGGMMGGLLGLGGGSGASGFSSAAVDIVTDARLNALIVYARPDDVDLVYRMLQIIDQRVGPTDVETDGRTRLIPVQNTSAAQVAEVVKQIYANRIEGGPGNMPSPEDLLRALRDGENGGASQGPSKMSIGVDSRSNSLVVRAPDALFYEVQDLVEKLDTEQLDSGQSTQIVSLQYTNPEAVKEALGNILGSQAISTEQQGGERRGDDDENAEQARRQQQEVMRRIQEFRERMQRGGGGGGGRGGGGRGGGGRGGR